MKRIAIIGTTGVPGRYGGFETLAHNLVINLKNTFNITVYNSTKNYEKKERFKTWNGARIVWIPLSANGIQSILYDMVSMIHAVFFADVLLILGVSGGIFVPVIRLFSTKKIIVNIDGLEWRRNKWSKPVKKFLRISEILAVKFSHATVTDNESIQRYASVYYRTTNLLIAYGADHVSHKNKDDSIFLKYPFAKEPYAFSVARIEPENNTHLILETFTKLSGEQIIFVGNWNHSEYARKLKEKYSTYSNIHLLDPIYDQKTLDSLRSNCKFYVHGHSAGGTNPSLVEAMYLGLPVFCYNVSYNRATTKEKAFYFNNSEELAKGIQSVSAEDLKKTAAVMQYIARMEYTWSVIASKYKQIILSFDFNYKKKTLDTWLSGLPEPVLYQNGLGHLKHTRYFYE